METDRTWSSPSLRAALLLGVLAGAALCATRHEVRQGIVSSPTVRVSPGAVLRGQTPDALRWAVEEAGRHRGVSDAAGWPPPRLLPPHAAPIADEGVFRTLSAPAPLALAWLRIPGAGEHTVQILAWPTEESDLVAPGADHAGPVVAHLPAPPRGAAVDAILRTLGAPTDFEREASAPRGAYTLALCVDGQGHGMLLQGRTRHMAAVKGLLVGLGCDRPGVVWRGTGRLAGTYRESAAGASGGWTLRGAAPPAVASAPR